jgi:hypothetical protein
MQLQAFFLQFCNFGGQAGPKPISKLRVWRYGFSQNWKTVNQVHSININMAALPSTIPTSLPISPKKSLSFDPAVTFREVSRLANSSNEMKSLYYCKRDYQNFKQNDKKMINLMETSRFPVDSCMKCTRGLEGKTMEGKCKKAFLRVESQIAVLTEQMLQQEEGEYDPEMIARVYKDFTREATEEAQDLAKSDAEYVRENVIDDGKPAKSSYLRLGRFAQKRQPRLRRVAGSAA